MPHKQIIEDICNGDCPAGKGEYCTLREILLHSGIPDRTLEQLKIVEVWKYLRGKTEEREITWGMAWQDYTDQGFAVKFSEAYKDGMKFKEIYRLVFGVDLT